MKYFGLRFLHISSLIPYYNAGKMTLRMAILQVKELNTQRLHTNMYKASDNTQRPCHFIILLQMNRDIFPEVRDVEKSIQRKGFSFLVWLFVLFFSDSPPDLST